MLSVAAYAVSRRKSLLPQAAFYLFYILEISAIFGTEFLSQNIRFSPEGYYDIPSPILRIFAGAAVLHCLWLMLLNILDVHDRRIELAPTIVFVIACAVVLVALPYGPFRQWLFYTLRQVYLAFGLLFALAKWRRSTDGDYRRRLGRFRKEYLFIWLLLALILIEDTLVILVMPMPSEEASWALLYLSERNFAENIMMLFVAYHTIRASLKALALRFFEPPVAQEGGDLSRHIEERLPAFASAHGLSNREREVLALVIEGKDNRTIAQELYLSEGTIKTHVHNIMKKSQAKNRDELKQAFWSA